MPDDISPLRYFTVFHKVRKVLLQKILCVKVDYLISYKYFNPIFVLLGCIQRQEFDCFYLAKSGQKIGPTLYYAEHDHDRSQKRALLNSFLSQT